ncbi:MAG: carnitine 3-dehydrogenase, partial [Gammaproteobacteria bacterium]|nr:carnitine 3-dehydrogenase [Gammaproteobacteria bacterium]
AGADDRLLATSEAMYLHVGRESGRVCPAGKDMVANAKTIAAAHAGLAVPDTVGRHVGQRNS